MKKLILLFSIFTCLLSISFSIAYADVYVHGYTRKDGTYVSPHYRSNPDSSPYNNWSYPGNTNPYTGKTATGSSYTYLKNYFSNTNLLDSISKTTYNLPTNTNTTIFPIYNFEEIDNSQNLKGSAEEEVYINITTKPSFSEQEKGIFSIKGNVAPICEKIIVVGLDANNKPFESYQLSKYETGQTEFTYNVNKKNYQNIKNGLNTYLISAICPNNEVVSDTLTNIYYWDSSL